MEACASIEKAIHDRALGWEEPVLYKGEQVHLTDVETGERKPLTRLWFSERLLLARAAAMMPERYGPKLQLDANVEATVDAPPAPQLVRPEHLERLSNDELIALQAIQEKALGLAPTAVIDTEYGELPEGEST